MDLKSKYFLIDCGTLLTNRKYQKDLDSVVERSKDVGKYIRRAVSSDPKTPEILSITLIFTYIHLRSSKHTGVVKLVCTGGITLNSVKEALRLTRLYPNTIYCTAGQ